MKINKILGFLATLFWGYSLMAAPIKNQPVTLVQPDGSKVSCFVSGDEYYNYYHNQDGFAIVQSSNDGYYYFAKLENDSLLPTDRRVDAKNQNRSNLIKHPMISNQSYQKRKALNSKTNNRATVNEPSGVLAGKYNNLSILVRFADQTEFTTPRSVFEDRYNSTTEYSMRTFFREASYNKLDMVTTIFPKVSDNSKNLSYQDKHVRAYYSPYNKFTNPIGYKGTTQERQRRDSLYYNAILSIKNQIPADLNLDSDNDDDIDNISFIIRGTTDGWSDLLWPQMNGYSYAPSITINGKYFDTNTKQPEPRADVHTLSHEMFHVLSAPDLYHYKDSFYSAVGPWDPMDSGTGHPLAFMKWKYSAQTWIKTIPEITQSGTYTLSPLSTSETNNCYKITTPASKALKQYFVVEYRKKGGLLEQNIPGDGLIIYRIAEKSLDGNASMPDEIYLYRPNGSLNKAGNINDAYFSKEAGRTQISDNTNPSCFLYKDAETSLPGGLKIYDISSANNNISFKVEMAGSGTEVLEPTITLDKTLANSSFSIGSTVTLAADVVGFKNTWVKNCYFYVNDIPIGFVEHNKTGYTAPGNFKLNWSTTGLSAGKYTIKIVATDAYPYSATVTFDLYLTTLSESFEGNFPPVGWTNIGWAASTTLAKSGKISAYSIFGKKEEAILTSPEIKITTPSYLEFYWANADLMTGKRSVFTDSSFFEIYDGNSWVENASLITDAIDKSFRKVIIDLTPYQNKSIKFRWRDRSNGSFDAVGTALDAISINSYSEQNGLAKFTSPEAGASLDQNSEIALSAVCGSSVTKALFFVDGNQIGEDSSAPYVQNYSTASLTNGPHEFKVEFYNGSTLVTTAFTPVVVQTSSFVKFIDYSPNGYGWGPGSSKKVSFEPQTQTIASPYRKRLQQDVFYTGNLTVSAGKWDNLTQKTIVNNPNGVAGSRYMTTFSIPGYHFVLAPYALSGDVYVGGLPTMAIYNTTTNSWSDTIVFRNNNQTFPDAYICAGAATKDQSGKFHLLTVWHNGGSYQNQAYIKGESLDGKNWTFADYKQNFLPVTTAFMEAGLPKIALSSTGFGVAMTRVQPLSSANDFVLGYCYTEDFGKTMIYNSGVEGKYFTLNNANLFSWLNQTAQGLKIDQVKIGEDYDMLLTESEEINFIVRINGINIQSGKIIQKLDNGTPVSGFYNITGKKSGETFSWSANFIAHNIGNSTQDVTNPSIPSKLETSSGKCQIGLAGTTLYATWLDRPHKYTTSSNFYNNTEYGYTYNTDAYFSYSNDGGKSWKTNTTITDYKYGVNITGTTSVTEDGFGISAKGVVNNNKLEFYAAYQQALTSMPIYPTNSIVDHKQKLYLRKYLVDLANMRVSYDDQTNITESTDIAGISLLTNYPNPFNPTTTISFNLDKAQKIKLSIYNVKGELVEQLINQNLRSGTHQVKFDGSRFNSGLYFYKVEGIDHSFVQKMIMVK